MSDLSSLSADQLGDDWKKLWHITLSVVVADVSQENAEKAALEFMEQILEHDAVAEAESWTDSCRD